MVYDLVHRTPSEKWYRSSRQILIRHMAHPRHPLGLFELASYGILFIWTRTGINTTPAATNSPKNGQTTPSSSPQSKHTTSFPCIADDATFAHDAPFRGVSSPLRRNCAAMRPRTDLHVRRSKHSCSDPRICPRSAEAFPNVGLRPADCSLLLRGHPAQGPRIIRVGKVWPAISCRSGVG